MTPRISILLPVWNAGSTLMTCLQSIRRQRGITWECILVDDGSIDRSLEIAHHCADADPRIRVHSRPHAGLIATLNAGITLSRAPIIARMDADDWMHHNRLRRQAELLEEHPELEAVSCFTRSFPRGELRAGRRHYESWLHSLRDPKRIWREGPKRLSRIDPRYAIERFTACRAWHLHRDFLADSPRYILWGHGRTGRALRKALAALGHRPAAIVDVHPRRIGLEIGGVPVISPTELTFQPAHPVVVSVSGLAPRNEIRAALAELDYREGTEFVCAA